MENNNIIKELINILIKYKNIKNLNKAKIIKNLAKFRNMIFIAKNRRIFEKSNFLNFDISQIFT